MEQLSSLALVWLVDYGAVILLGLLFLGGLGLPLPGMLLVIAAGAFVRQDLLNLSSAALFSLLGVMAGDLAVYGIGRWARGPLERRWGEKPRWQKARRKFEQRGGWAVYLTRWALTPLAFPTSLIAGGSGYRLWLFLLFDFLGELTWLLIYGGLGYLFGAQWELVTDLLENFSGLILAALAVLLGIILLLRIWGRGCKERKERKEQRKKR